jgi:hypothetical protein
VTPGAGVAFLAAGGERVDLTAAIGDFDDLPGIGQLFELAEAALEFSGDDAHV